MSVCGPDAGAGLGADKYAEVLVGRGEYLERRNQGVVISRVPHGRRLGTLGSLAGGTGLPHKPRKGTHFVKSYQARCLVPGA